LKIVRILQGGQDTFAIVTENGRAITRDELISQIGLLLPFDVEQFIFEESFQKINDYGIDKLSFSHQINEFHLLPPLKESFKIICLAFNYTDQGSWVSLEKIRQKNP
jgi:hypothetical protein